MSAGPASAERFPTGVACAGRTWNASLPGHPDGLAGDQVLGAGPGVDPGFIEDHPVVHVAFEDAQKELEEMNLAAKQQRLSDAREAWLHALELDPSNTKLMDRFREHGMGDPDQDERIQQAKRRVSEKIQLQQSSQ